MKDERQIARKAEQMLQDSLLQKVGGFKSHYTKSNEDEANKLKNAQVKARIKKYGLVKNDTANYYMRALNIRMDRHGFVQHYGIDTIRASGERTRTSPKATTYGFKHHVMQMTAQPFIDSAIIDSGVVPFVLREIIKHRGEHIMLSIKKFMEE